MFEKRFLFSLLSLLPGGDCHGDHRCCNCFVFPLIGHLSGILTVLAFVEVAPLEIKGNLFDPAIDFIPYFDINQAQSALEANSIQAYYVIPETFPKSRQVELFFLKTPSEQAQGQFVQWTRQNMDPYQTMDPLILEGFKRAACSHGIIGWQP